MPHCNGNFTASDPGGKVAQISVDLVMSNIYTEAMKSYGRKIMPRLGGNMTQAEGRDLNEIVRRFAEQASGLGIQIVDVAGNVGEVAQRLNHQDNLLGDIRQQMQELGQDNARIDEGARANLNIARQATDEVAQSQANLQASVDSIASLVGSVAEGQQLLSDLQEALRNVAKAADSIDSIARQTNMLALNATIEAARAGEAGKGFAVVAGEVKNLANQTGQATKAITDTLAHLTAQAQRLIEQGGLNAERARSVGEASSLIADTFQAIGSTVERIAGESATIATAAEAIRDRSHSLLDKVADLGTGVSQSNNNLKAIDERLKGLLNAGEKLISITVDSGVETADTPFVKEVLHRAELVSAALEKAIDAGQISLDAMLDQNYVKIPGSDPEQFTTRYLEIFDRVLTPVLDGALSFSTRVVFCVPVDHNGYLPTHNSKCSQKPGPDPVRNASNCRNRRFFNDRVGLAAARNADRFIVQTYRRDMGGGKSTLMMDVSAPIRVKGQHWGGLRLGYTA
jgi:methyl-accepting chemotaxis protein